MLKYSSFMSMHCKNQECVIDFSNANLFFTFKGGGELLSINIEQHNGWYIES